VLQVEEGHMAVSPNGYRFICLKLPSRNWKVSGKARTFKSLRRRMIPEIEKKRRVVIEREN